MKKIGFSLLLLILIITLGIKVQAVGEKILRIDGVDLLANNEVELEQGSASYDAQTGVLTLIDATTTSKGLEAQNLNLVIEIRGENQLVGTNRAYSMEFIDCTSVAISGDLTSTLDLPNGLYLAGGALSLTQITVDASLGSMEWTRPGIEVLSDASLTLNQDSVLKAKGSMNPLGIYASAAVVRNLVLNGNASLELIGGNSDIRTNDAVLNSENSSLILNDTAQINVLGYNKVGITTRSLTINDEANVTIRIEKDENQNSEYATGLLVNQDLSVNNQASLDIYSAGIGITSRAANINMNFNDDAAVEVFAADNSPAIYILKGILNLNANASLTVTATKSNLGIVVGTLNILGNAKLLVNVRTLGYALYLDDVLLMESGSLSVNADIRASGNIMVEDGTLNAERVISSEGKVSILGGNITIVKIISGEPATLFITLSDKAKEYISLTKTTYEVGEVVNLVVAPNFDQLIYANNELVTNNSFIMPNELVTITVREQVLEDADYREVERLVEKANALDSKLYENFEIVEEAIAAIVWDKKATEQDIVDGYALALEAAIAALEYKEADYSRVESIISRANSLDRSVYKDFSAVDEAIARVVYGKDIREQEVVDNYVKDIEQAINSLKLKEDYTWYFVTGSILLLALVGVGVVIVIRNKNRKED